MVSEVFTLSESHSAYWWMTKHHSWYVIVIKLQMSLALKQSVC